MLILRLYIVCQLLAAVTCYIPARISTNSRHRLVPLCDAGTDGSESKTEAPKVETERPVAVKPAPSPATKTSSDGLEIPTFIGGFGIGLVAGGLLDGILANGDAPWAAPVGAALLGGTTYYGVVQDEVAEVSTFLKSNLGTPVSKIPDNLKQAAINAADNIKTSLAKKVDSTVEEITSIPTKIQTSVIKAADNTKNEILNIPTVVQKQANQAVLDAQNAAAKQANAFVEDLQATPGRAADALKAQATKVIDDLVAIPQQVANDAQKKLEAQTLEVKKLLGIDVSSPAKSAPTPIKVAAKVAPPPPVKVMPPPPPAPKPVVKAPEPVKTLPKPVAKAPEPPKKVEPVKPATTSASIKKDESPPAGGFFSFLDSSSAPATPVKPAPQPPKPAAKAPESSPAGGFFSFLDSSPAPVTPVKPVPVTPAKSASPVKFAPVKPVKSASVTPAKPAATPVPTKKDESAPAGGFFSFLDSSSAPAASTKIAAKPVEVATKSSPAPATAKPATPAVVIKTPERFTPKVSFMKPITTINKPAALVSKAPEKTAAPVASAKAATSPVGGGFFSFMNSAPEPTKASSTTAPASAVKPAPPAVKVLFQPARKVEPVKTAAPVATKLAAKAPEPPKKVEPVKPAATPTPTKKDESASKGGFFSFLDSKPAASPTPIKKAEPALKASEKKAAEVPVKAAAPDNKAIAIAAAKKASEEKAKKATADKAKRDAESQAKNEALARLMAKSLADDKAKSAKKFDASALYEPATPRDIPFKSVAAAPAPAKQVSTPPAAKQSSPPPAVKIAPLQSKTAPQKTYSGGSFFIDDAKPLMLPKIQDAKPKGDKGPSIKVSTVLVSKKKMVFISSFFSPSCLIWFDRHFVISFASKLTHLISEYSIVLLSSPLPSSFFSLSRLFVATYLVPPLSF